MSIEFESVLKERYAELCGKNDKGDGKSGDNSSNSEDSDDESTFFVFTSVLNSCGSKGRSFLFCLRNFPTETDAVPSANWL